MDWCRVLAAGFVAAAALPAFEATACGDKFLLLGRSLRYEEAYASKHPAAVLVYANPGRAFVAIASEVTSVLKKAGHEPFAADAEEILEQALRKSSYAVVLADFEDVGPARRAVAEAGSNAIVVGVLVDPADGALADARRTYPCVMQAKARDRRVLAVVNGISRETSRGRPVACQGP